jgi:murein DD-endopeptidase MepM/ murein hydrolase activator NlpD
MSSLKSDGEIIAETIKSFQKQPMRNDPAGLGHFGASRNKAGGGKRLHPGTDYENNVGDMVGSPVVGTVTKLGYTYPSDLSYRYVRVTDIDGNDHRMYYVQPKEGLKEGTLVNKGDVIGTAQDVVAHAKKENPNSQMKQHIHYEILDPDGVAIDQDTYKQRRIASQDDVDNGIAGI